MTLPEGWLTSQQAADLVRVHLRTIHGWVASGRLVPAGQLPGRTGALLFRREDVERATRLRRVIVDHETVRQDVEVPVYEWRDPDEVAS